MRLYIAVVIADYFTDKDLEEDAIHSIRSQIQSHIEQD